MTLRVRCEIPVNANGEEHPDSHALTAGGVYLVIEVGVNVGPPEPLALRIVDDAGTPSIWPARIFTTVSSRIPSNWIVQLDDRGGLDLRPSSFAIPGFWEAYFDDEPGALATYARELEVTEREA